MSYEKEWEILREAVAIAGSAINDIAAHGFETRDKGGNDPVTTADLEADRILRDHLLGNFPADGWLSEETRDDPVRLSKPRVWIVDPIDGTREFVQGTPEFAVSVALVEDGVPVVAAVLNPATGERFMARRGHGVQLGDDAVRADHLPR